MVVFGEIQLIKYCPIYFHLSTLSCIYHKTTKSKNSPTLYLKLKVFLIKIPMKLFIRLIFIAIAFIILLW